MASHGGRIQSFLFRMLGDAATAEDVAQEVFVRIYERGARPPDGARLDTWLLRAARHRALDLLRARESRARSLDTLARHPPTPPVEPDENLERQELHARFEQALAVLPEPYRSVFVLREIHGLSYEDIGRTVDANMKTVSSRLHRARAHLRASLARYLDHDGGTP